MLTTLRVIKLFVPVLVFFGVFSSSCSKDDSENNNNTNNNNVNNNTGNCNNQGSLNYGNCITCVAIISYSNGQPAYTYSDTFCPQDFSSQAAFRAYIASTCSYDGYVGQGSGYMFSYTVTCRN